MDEGRPAPRFVLVRTSDGPLCRMRADVSDDAVEALVTAALREPPLGDPDAAPACDVDVTMFLSPVERTGGGPFYSFPSVISPDASVVEVTGENAYLVPEEIGGVIDRELPAFGAMVGDRVVAVARTARLVDGAAQAGVNTLEAYRRKGYGSRVVLAWGRAMRKMRREPIYSTSYDNAASRGLAKSAGLKLMGTDWNVY